MQFKEFDLDSRLLQNLQAIGFDQPTPIQTAAVPPGMEGRDILGSAETGTGKTAAFLLPILQRLISTERTRAPRALIVVPTRELALQVTDHAEVLSRNLPVRVATIYGGVGYGQQKQALKRGIDIIIATPGRLLDHAGQGNIDFSALQVLVLDEADRMLDIGFLPDIRRIVRLVPAERQTMLFSATLEPIVALAREVTRQPVRVEVEQAATPEAITQAIFPVPEHLKFDLLQHLLSEEAMESVLVFTRTKRRADRLSRKLRGANISAMVIHGNRSQRQRVKALEAFRDGKTRVLVATDIAARGLDVEGISHVINYDVPTQPEDYVHRIGRTGRAQAVGQAYTMVTSADFRMVHRIEYVLQEKLERRTVEDLDYSKPLINKPDAEAIRRYREANRGKPNGAPKSGSAKRRRRRNRSRRPQQEQN